MARVWLDFISVSLCTNLLFWKQVDLLCSFLANEIRVRPTLIDLKREALGIKKLFNFFNLTKINRKANMVAPEIVKFSFDQSHGVLVSSVPPCVVYVVTNDCRNVRKRGKPPYEHYT